MTDSPYRCMSCNTVQTLSAPRLMVDTKSFAECAKCSRCGRAYFSSDLAPNTAAKGLRIGR